MSLQDSEEQKKPTEEQFFFRWDYRTQCDFDKAENQKKKKHGAWVFAIVTVLVFGILLGLLGTVLWINAPDARLSASYAADTTEEVAEKVKPQTVLIYATNATTGGYGTGFFMTSDGYIATNYHVVGGMTHVSVTLYSGEVLEARVVGGYEEGDLAVLKISGNGYSAVSIGNSDALRVGDTAIAIGNPAGDTCAWSTTKGIVSAIDRKITVNDSTSITELTMIQMDTPVNPGNSGGPLCNANGEVIGIVTRKMTDYEGLGLAIPINGANDVLQSIIRYGSYTKATSDIARTRPAIGVTASSIKEGDPYTYGGVEYYAGRTGVLVNSVTVGGPAYGYLQVADIILSVNGTAVSDMDQMIEMLYGFKAGDEIRFRVYRDGSEISVTMRIGILSN